MNRKPDSLEINELPSVDKTRTTAQISEQNTENDPLEGSTPSNSTAVSRDVSATGMSAGLPSASSGDQCRHVGASPRPYRPRPHLCRGGVFRPIHAGPTRRTGSILQPGADARPFHRFRRIQKPLASISPPVHPGRPSAARSPIAFQPSSGAWLPSAGTVPSAAWCSIARIAPSPLSWPASATATPRRRVRKRRCCLKT